MLDKYCFQFFTSRNSTSLPSLCTKCCLRTGLERGLLSWKEEGRCFFNLKYRMCGLQFRRLTAFPAQIMDLAQYPRQPWERWLVWLSSELLELWLLVSLREVILTTPPSVQIFWKLVEVDRRLLISETAEMGIATAMTTHRDSGSIMGNTTGRNWAAPSPIL